MELLLFFFISLFGGIFAAYYVEGKLGLSKEFPKSETKITTSAISEKMLRLSRQLRSGQIH
ncbi:hypothetical protein [Arundinibacter roseus]|uniref:Uncharacterized protein n=1 Tax=Arundinibacter roseus TaxID=2070510 RepID=A0A4R4KC24_9BACT|nr:hypothetical protein [Arundinibacter roseus]TDB65183.1 hypothetical protein EZE20_10765 [Arundinibacter roseus]